MSWRTLFSKYPEILQSYTACKTVVYDASPCYLIPRVAKSSNFTWDDHGSYITLGAKGSSPIVMPVTLESPKQYMEAIMETVAVYGGAYSIPASYSKPLGKMGYKLIKRPWGNLDFIFETEVLANLSGKRHERKRTGLNKLTKQGYSCRPMTKDDAPLVHQIETLWDTAHKGKTGRHGYATVLAQGLGDYPPAMRVTGVVCHAPDGQAVGVAMSAQITSDTWSCSFRYADNVHAGTSLLMFREMARAYPDLKYEADGSGGAIGSSLFEFKRRLVDNSNLLIEMYVVMK